MWSLIRGSEEKTNRQSNGNRDAYIKMDVWCNKKI